MKTVLATALSVSMCSCACLINGPKQQVQINSNPPGAAISINGIPSGQTPNSVSLERNEVHQVQLTKENYSPVSQSIGHRLSVWFWPDILCYAVPGLVDLGVGAAYVLEPEAINAQLHQVETMPAQPDLTQKMLDAKKLLDSGVITKDEFEAIKTKALQSLLQNSEKSQDN